MRQGIPLREDEVRRIVELLHNEEMSLKDIAERMGTQRSAIAHMNRKLKIRVYGGRRNTWTVETEQSIISKGFAEAGASQHAHLAPERRSE